MTSYVKFLIRHRKIIITAMALVTVALLTQLRDFAVVIDLEKTIPQSHPNVVVANRIKKLFGTDNTMVIGVTANSGTVFQTPILGKIKRITEEISQLPNVIPTSILSLATRRAKNIVGTNDGALDVRPFMESVPSDQPGLDRLRASLKENPLYSGLLVSQDERTLFVLADVRQSPKGFQSIVDRVLNVVKAEEDSSVTIDVGGPPLFAGTIERMSQRMAFLFPLAILLIGLIHYEAFRTVQALALPLVTALLAVVWSLGIMGFMGVPLDVFNVVTPILILAIAAGHAVQILKRYYEDFDSIKKEQPSLLPREASHLAIVRSITKVGPVMLAAGTIAAASFFSLIVFEIKAIKVFGIFAGLGILCTLILEMTFIPALRSLLPPPGTDESRREKQHTLWDKIVQKCAHVSLFRRKSVYIGTLLLIVIFSYGSTLLVVDGSLKEYFYGDIDALKWDRNLNNQLAGAFVLYGLIEGQTEDAIKNPKVLEAMEKVQHFLESQPMVGKTLSLADFIKRINFAMHGNSPEFNKLPDRQDLISQYLFLYSASGEPTDFDNYVDTKYQNAPIFIFVKSINNVFISDLIKKTNGYAQPLFNQGAKFRMGGVASESAAISEVLVRDKMLNIIQLAFVVFLISSLLFRSAIAGLLILVPLGMTVLANFGIMGLFGITLETATAVVSAMAVGIGADYAIYLTFRFREELSKSSNEEEAIKKTFGSAGKAILFVSSAVAGGYAMLMLSYGFLVHFSLGFLMCMAMIVSSLSSLIIFPSLIFSIRPKFIFQKETPSHDSSSDDNFRRGRSVARNRSA